ncbi:MAG TPA: hypothetical protein VNS58_00225 [Puia sp.]|nr:hypothetical protein [Puia sp.]
METTGRLKVSGSIAGSGEKDCKAGFLVGNKLFNEDQNINS